MPAIADLDRLRELERDRSFAIGRLAGAAHGLIVTHPSQFPILKDALAAYDASERALIDYLYLATKLERTAS